MLSKIKFTILFALLFAASSSLFAFDSSDSIVVSASKIGVTSEKTGLSVTVIDSDEIRKSGTSSVSQLLNRQYGVSVSSTSSFGGVASLFLRGTDSNRYCIMIDGVKLNDPTLYSGGFDLSNLSLLNVDRIEIVRGSQSVVNGSDALGGVINIVTKKGEGNGASYYMSYGTYNDSTVGASVSSAGEKGNLFMSGYYQRADGFSKADSKGSDGDYDDDSYRNINFSGSGKYGLNDKFSLEITSSFTDTKLDIDDYAWEDDPNRYNLNTVFSSNAALNFKPFDFFSMKANGSYYRIYRRDIDPADSVDTAENESTESVGERKTAGVSAQLSAGEILKFVAGVEGESERSSFSSISASYGTQIFDEKFSSHAAYAQNSLFLGEYATVNCGLRYNKDNPGDSDVCYQTSASAKLPVINTLIRGSFSRGFKSPEIIQIYHPYYGNKELETERSYSYDAGLTQKMFEDKVEMDIGVFRINMENQIDFNTSTWKYVNIGKSFTKGFEFSAKLKPVKFLHFSGNYTYLKTENRDTGKSLYKRPKNKAYSSVSFVKNERTDVTLMFEYTGKRTDYGDEKLDAFYVFNISANYGLGEMTSVFVSANNILNREYSEIDGYKTSGFNVKAGLKGNF